LIVKWGVRFLMPPIPDFPGRERTLLVIAPPQWTPQRALKNYAMALRKLGWHWRFKVLADGLGMRPVLLGNEHDLLQNRISRRFGTR
jgi:hypothetical protein